MNEEANATYLKNQAANAVGYEAYQKQVQRYGGGPRRPKVVLPALLLVFAVAWWVARSQGGNASVIAALVIVVVYLYAPYYVMKCLLRAKMVGHLEWARSRRMPTFYSPSPRLWAGFYLVMLLTPVCLLAWLSRQLA